MVNKKQGHCVIALGPNIWGKGKFIDEAMKNGDIRKSDTHLIYFCSDENATVNGMGDIVHKSGTICVLIGSHKRKNN